MGAVSLFMLPVWAWLLDMAELPVPLGLGHCMCCGAGVAVVLALEVTGTYKVDYLPSSLFPGARVLSLIRHGTVCYHV